MSLLIGLDTHCRILTINLMVAILKEIMKLHFTGREESLLTQLDIKLTRMESVLAGHYIYQDVGDWCLVFIIDL